jgi:hypothetical protein
VRRHSPALVPKKILAILETHADRDVLVAQVRAENGWITLSGEVEWDYQRQSAKDAVRSLLGVVGVSDDISVKPKASMSAVKSEIEAPSKRLGGDSEYSKMFWAERAMSPSVRLLSPGSLTSISTAKPLTPDTRCTARSACHFSV